MLSRLSKNRLVVAIRREDPKRIWERRAPLSPDDVHALLSKFPVEVHVAPCHRRVFPTEEYEKAGAVISKDLSHADIVLGIKEVPLNELGSNGRSTPPPTHIMFSHTHKGQAYNTPLLSRFVAHQHAPSEHKQRFPTLVDYELLTDSAGKRTVGFGWFAGVAGVLESLSSMAHAHLEQGISSPFLYTPRPHTVPSLDEARVQLRKIGALIAAHGTPSALGPFVIGLTGRGNVSQGCLSMLSELPIEKVPAQRLSSLVQDPNTDRRKIYLVHVEPSDYLVTLDGQPYNRELYYNSPQSYKSIFYDTVAPYLTLLLNGTGWSPGFPRLMSNDQLQAALERAKLLPGPRFTNVGDISCDIEGGLEFLTRPTTLSSPSYRSRPPTLPAHYPSITMMSVDILPASMPLDASKHFASVLRPYLHSLINNRLTGAPQKDEYMQALDRATVAKQGELKEQHAWLQPRVNEFHQTQSEAAASGKSTKASANAATPSSPAPARPKRILMLGSGMVAKPAVDMIARHPGMELVIASNSLLELQPLAQPHLNVKYRIVDTANASTYRHLIKEADVVISLLPVHFHPIIASTCVELRKHLVTASYISKEMQDLDASAREADVLLLNEIGLDPGIDHCSAIQLISSLHAQRKKVVSFTSFCGGLPAPEDSRVPLRYKFSWRPQGVLTATQNGASFKLGGEYKTISGDQLLRSAFPDVPVTDQFPLEGIANRESLPYCDTYSLDSNAMRTVIRGTLRYPGFASLMSSFIKLGLLERNTNIYLNSWHDLLRASLTHKYPTHNGAIPSLSSLFAGEHEQLAEVADALEWLGLLPRSTIVDSRGASGNMPLLPSEPMTPLDIFAYLLADKLRYAPRERDMVVLSHEFITRDHHPSTPTEETVYTSSLIAYGNDEGSAMARTVGIPVAIAAITVAEGKVDPSVRGVAGPTHRTVYEPVLSGLAKVGLRMTETTRKVPAFSGLRKFGFGQAGAATVEQALVRGSTSEQRSKLEDQFGHGAETEEQRRDLETEWKI
ncbi:hypothetical protein FA15DRAFT_638562 [Coprinopsis marcescibilis]|uniref:Alanine dehydrogenase/pyridine nucleotide transhydrogenase N-terminal domain-containing protein n=1 Tax=Coprinopsis marcescibilis TaxID=230819 RepID=A0A5C3L078_COPMA|nr:hypothetical protein FA15DRAFT_638562 [Coprinopsis marcescibilis]